MDGLAAALDEGALRKLARGQGFKIEKKRRSVRTWGEPSRYRIMTPARDCIGGYDYGLTFDGVVQFLLVPSVPQIQLERIKYEIIKQIREEGEIRSQRQNSRTIRQLERLGDQHEAPTRCRYPSGRA